MKNAYWILFLIISNSLCHKLKANANDDTLLSFLKSEDEKEQDPLNYNDIIWLKSFQNFLETFFEEDKIDVSTCYYELKDEGTKAAKDFIKKFNHVVFSSEHANRTNLSLDLNIGKLCKFTNSTSFEDASAPSKDSAKNTYIISKNYFNEMINSDFWITLLKFNFCHRHEKGNMNVTEKWVVLEDYINYLRIFDSFCSIQNIYYYFNTEVYKKTVQAPFVMMAETIRNYFESIRPHLDHMEKLKKSK